MTTDTILIACPACGASFRAPQAAIPPGGRRLRCTACSHEWHYVGDTVTADETPVPETNLSQAPLVHEPVPGFLGDDGASSAGGFAEVMRQTAEAAPASVDGLRPRVDPLALKKAPFWLLDRAGLMGYGAAVLVGLVFLNILGSSQYLVTSLLPRAQAVYSAAGMATVIGQPDLVFQNVTFQFKDGSLTIKGEVKNQDKVQQNAQPIRMALVGDARPEPLTIWVARLDKPYLDPGQVVPFTITRPFDQGAAVTKVNLRFLAP